MPPVSRWMIRISLVSLLAGAAVGALLLAQLPAALAHEGTLRAIHLDLMLFGWLMQFVLGVAYWMLPRYPTLPERGSPAAAWSALALFDAGLLTAIVGWTLSLTGLASLGRAALVGGTLVFLGVLVPRVKGMEVRGEK